MMFFELKQRTKNLPLWQKLWMYPAAYTLLGVANTTVWAVDKFNRATFRIMARV